MRKVHAVFFEALLVAVLGLFFGLAANALSPRGLRLSRNYFPGADPLPPAASAAAKSGTTSERANSAPPEEATLQRLRQRGLQLVTGNEAVKLFRDQRYEQGLVVFVDARDDQHYAAGHIPGAWPFDHYRADTSLPTVLPACLTALQVVVYCSGGECEDSEFATVMLRDAGVPREVLFVYAAGFSEWKTNGLPVEMGTRRSGAFLKPGP